MRANALFVGSTGRRSHESDGFTLVEVLVALVLLGLISMILFSSFQFGVRAWEAGSARVVQVDQVDVVQTLLRNELSEASQLPVKPGVSAFESTFAGSPGELRFSGPMSVSLGLGGTHVFVLSTAGTGRDRSLVVRWQLYRPDMSLDDDKWSDPVVLMSGVTDLELTYFGATEEDERPTWRDSWKEKDALPELIRLRVFFRHADPRWWPDLIVAPMILETGVVQ